MLTPTQWPLAWSVGQLGDVAISDTLAIVPEFGQSGIYSPSSPSAVLGHPFRGTHKKMNGSAEQEICEFVRLKHHSHELKRHHLANCSLFRDQGVGGSNPLSPTNSFQSLTILQILQIEPLVRLLWVPRLKYRFPQHLSPLAERRLGYPIGAPIRITFFQNSRICQLKMRVSRWSAI